MYDISVTTIDGQPLSMATYRDRSLLIVNVASRCGFTPQYAGLESLYRRLKARQFVVLGFPCNQFGGQEPGSESDIKRFCAEHYEVTFPLFAKVDVNGPAAHPLFRFLTSARRGPFGIRTILWNFTKFFVTRQGEVIRRFGSRVGPEAIEKEILPLI